MTGQSGMTDFERFVASWLEDDGPQDVRAELVEAGIVGARNSRQHRGLEGAVFGSGAWPRPRSVGRSLPLQRLTIVLVILLAAAAAAVLIGGLIRLPSPVEPPGRVDHLAYSVDGDIYLADPDGRNPIRIADGTENSGFGEVSWSPDGRHMSLDGDGNVDVVDLTGRIVFSTPGCCSAWSPDGKLIVILVSFGGGGGPPDAQSGGAEFVIVDAEGTVRSSLPAGVGSPNFLGSGVDIHWTPDGRSITFTGVTFGGGDPPPGRCYQSQAGTAPRSPSLPSPVPSRSTRPMGRKWLGSRGTEPSWWRLPTARQPDHSCLRGACPGSRAGTGRCGRPMRLGSRHPDRRIAAISSTSSMSRPGTPQSCRRVSPSGTRQRRSMPSVGMASATGSCSVPRTGCPRSAVAARTHSSWSKVGLRVRSSRCIAGDREGEAMGHR